jgi:histidinol-phosphate aminotransferase
VLLSDFEPQVDAILMENTKCFLLISTGNSFSDENVVSLLQNFNGFSVVIDERISTFKRNKVG